jgi:hypothetical protein
LLDEFTDHGSAATVSTGVMGSGETLWIPLSKEWLTKLLDRLDQGDVSHYERAKWVIHPASAVDFSSRFNTRWYHLGR